MAITPKSHRPDIDISDDRKVVKRVANQKALIAIDIMADAHLMGYLTPEIIPHLPHCDLTESFWMFFDTGKQFDFSDKPAGVYMMVGNILFYDDDSGAFIGQIKPVSGSPMFHLATLVHKEYMDSRIGKKRERALIKEQKTSLDMARNIYLIDNHSDDYD